MRQSRFVPISGLAVLIIILLSVSSFFFFLPAYHLVLKDIIKDSAVQAADYLADPFKIKGQSISRETIQPEYDKLAAEFIRDRRLIKLQVLSNTWEIVYSSNPNEIGTTDRQGNLLKAAAEGSPMTRVVIKGVLPCNERIQASDILETFMPVVVHGKFLGAFVFFHNITGVKKQFDLVFEKYMATVLPIFLVLLGVVFILTNRVRRSLRQREIAEEELQRSHTELEERVRERISELNKTNDELVKEIYKRELYEEELLLAAKVFESVIEGVCITSASGEIERVNQGFTSITGYTEAEVVGENPRILKSGRHDSVFYQNMWSSLLESGKWQGEIWNRRKNGEIYRELLSISSIKDAKNKITHYVGIFYDIRNLLRRQEQLTYKAYHDPLTDLPNRELFFDRLEKLLSHAKRNRQQCALMFVDLDDFKMVNDNLGHQFGDIFLREVASRLRSCCRDEDTVARYGGDEFVMVLGELNDENDVIGMAERVFAIMDPPVQYGQKNMKITASIGIAVFPKDAQNLRDLIAEADRAMYYAKKSGKHSYQLSSQIKK